MEGNALMQEEPLASSSGLSMCESGVPILSTTTTSVVSGVVENGDTSGVSSEVTTRSNSYKGALVLQISEAEVRATLVTEEGRLTPLQNECENGVYTVPFLTALIKNEFFVFGPSVLDYVDRAKKSSKFKRCSFIRWDVGTLLNQPDETSNFKLIVINERNLVASIELLAGLFLKHLKTSVETRFNIKWIDTVILNVPLWFGSLQRQRLKDAAKIAGFHENFVVNEVSTITHLHFASKCLSPSTRQDFLVCSENSGKIDLVFYEGVSGTPLKMVACAGSQYKASSYSGNIKRDQYEKFKGSNDEKSLRNVRKCLLHSLYKELKEKLLKLRKEQAAHDVLMFCQDQRWKDIFEEEVNRGVIYYEHLGADPVSSMNNIAAPLNWSPPVIPLADLCGIELQDLIMYGVYRSDVIIGKWTVTILDEGLVPCDGIMSMKSVTFYPTSQTVIFQKNAFNEKYPIGTIDIERMLYYRYSQIEIQLIMTQEGTIELKSLYACDRNGQPIKQLHSPEDYRWRPSCLSGKDLHIASGHLKDILLLGTKYTEDVFLWNEIVWRLCDELKSKLWFRACKKGTPSVVEERVDTILDVIKFSCPLFDFHVEKLQKWVLELEEYKAKYFELK